MKWLTSLVVGLAAAVAAAAEPTLELPKDATVRPGRLLKVEPKGDFEQCRWRLMYGVTPDGKLVKPSEVDLLPVDGGRAAVFAAVPAGEYAVTATAWNKDGVADAVMVISVRGDGPKPPPDDDRQPAGRTLYLAVVRDPGQVTPAQAAVLGDTAFLTAAVGPGGDWDAFDHTSQLADRKGYLTQASAVQTAGSPYRAAAVVLDGKTGKVLTVAPLPDTKEGLQALLKRARG